VQFRPGAELEEQIKAFAAKHDLQVNEACKVLVALAVSSMDVRYYDLINQMAEAMGGVNPFVRACVRVQAALEGAALATGKPLQLESDGSRFILQVVKDNLGREGHSSPHGGPLVLCAGTEQAPRGENTRVNERWALWESAA
jgi:hypothetical protein